jgi:hypothetical protein
MSFSHNCSAVLYGHRKLAARQWSMSIQLLIELLLISETNSNCFNKAFRSLMELSNYREKAVKIAALLGINLRNVQSYRQAVEKNVEKKREEHRDKVIQKMKEVMSSIERKDQQQLSDIRAAQALQAISQSHIDPDAIDEDDLASETSSLSGKPCPSVDAVDIDEDILEDVLVDDSKTDHQSSSHRITRASLAQFDMQQSVSVVDIPLLHKMNDLFQMIDDARILIKSSNASPLQSSSASLAERFRVIRSQDASKDKQFQLLADCTKKIFQSFHTRSWDCILPKKDYPLAEEEFANFNPSSIAARCYFTPHEDELILRGLANHLASLKLNKASVSGVDPSEKSNTSAATATASGYDAIDDKQLWQEIHAKLLPSKDENALHYRYSQLIAASASSSTHSESTRKTTSERFQEYLKLKQQYESRMSSSQNKSPRWTVFEDMQLLRGFQVHGSKWHLINLFFLPNKSWKDIRTRLVDSRIYS